MKDTSPFGLVLIEKTPYIAGVFLFLHPMVYLCSETSIWSVLPLVRGHAWFLSQNAATASGLSVREDSPAQNGELMKKKIANEGDDELRPEYDLHQLLKGGVRGKYAERYRAGTNLVLLAPDVVKAFPSEQAVNEALRLVIKLTKIPETK